MRRRQALYLCLASDRKAHFHAAAVAVRMHAFGEAAPDKPVDQPYGAVMPKLEPLGQFAYGDVVASRESLDGQESLMLLGGESGLHSGLLTESLETPERVAQLGEQLVVGL